MSAYKKYGPIFGDLIFEMVDFFYIKKDLYSLYAQYEKLCNQKFKNLDLFFPFKTQKSLDKKEFRLPLCISVGCKIAHGRVKKKEIGLLENTISIDFGLGLRLKNKTIINLDAAVTLANSDEPWIKGPLVALKEIVKQNPKNTMEVSRIIKETAEISCASQVLSLTGHGIGKNLHEAPHIYNAPGGFFSIPLFNGFCFCAEPIFLERKETNDLISSVYLGEDGWTIFSTEKNRSSHFETTFLVENGQVIDVVGITEKEWIK